MPGRRRLMRGGAAAMVAGFAGPWAVHHAWAQGKAKKPLRIGLATDDTGPYAASGQDEQRGMLMAITEANARGGVLGRKIETVHTDTAGDPAIATGVATQMLEKQEVAFLLGAVHSGVAAAMSKVAQAHGCIYFNTNSSSPTEAGKDCHRVKFVWDGNGTNFSTSVVKGAMTGFGRDWVLVTSDYTWGHNTARSIRSIVESNGGRVIEELKVAQNERDFKPVLERIRKINPGVIATAVGGDDHFDAYMKPQTHQLQQTIYMAAYSDQPRRADDLFRILGRLRPQEVEDRASTQQCALESYAATPSYEP